MSCKRWQGFSWCSREQRGRMEIVIHTNAKKELPLGQVL
jgi:hypothetical protein